jgi:hypothetical protein
MNWYKISTSDCSTSFFKAGILNSPSRRSTQVVPLNIDGSDGSDSVPPGSKTGMTLNPVFFAFFETVDSSQTPDTSDNDASDEKVEALAEMLCRGGDEPETRSAALLVLMATIENSKHPKALANTAKQLAFTRCGELNLYGGRGAGCNS